MHTPTTGWLLRGTDGRLTAYAPRAEGIARWTEDRPGGPSWTGPELLAAPGLLPYLSVSQGPDGYAHLVGLRRQPKDNGEVATDVVHATQFQPGRPPTMWRALGTPYGGDWRRAEQIGLPAAVVGHSGALHVFVRNAGGGVCGRRQDAKGSWGGWLDLKGYDLLDGLSAAATEDGRIDVIAPARQGAHRWSQEKPGGDLKRAPAVPAVAVAGTATSAATGETGVTHFWRDAKNGEVRAWRAGAEDADPSDAGALDTGVVDAGASGADASDPRGEEAPDGVVGSLGGGAGTGPVALLRTAIDGHDCTVLAQRTEAGRVAVAAYPTGDESAGAFWSETGGECVGAPALALDARGRVVLAAIAADGGLRVARQRAEEPGLALGAWVPA
ncbi:hypothetical protein AB0I22_08025 [Streptomyces sp. NPDC050610]|uniref:hypothetical protein n=1 Tax=Streptomyces sp. NPDC050610 TaxID=3157097 RepID=UPI0034305C31